MYPASRWGDWPWIPEGIEPDLMRVVTFRADEMRRGWMPSLLRGLVSAYKLSLRLHRA